MRAQGLGHAGVMLLPLAAARRAADAEPVTLVTPLVYGTHLPGLGEPRREPRQD